MNQTVNSLLKTQGGANLPLIATNAAALTKSDTAVFPPFILYVGTTGNVVVQTQGGNKVTFTNIQDGSFLPILITMVYSTDTTASDFVRLW